LNGSKSQGLRRAIGENRTDKKVRNLHRTSGMKIGQEGGKVIVSPVCIIRANQPRLVDEQTTKSRYENSGAAYQAIMQV
jgi:hypothetical protein